MLYLNSIIGKGEVALGLKILILSLSTVAIFVCLGLFLWSIAGVLASLKAASERPTAIFVTTFWIAMMAASLAAIVWCFSNILGTAPKEVSRNASLTEVSDLITVDGDKVEIKPFGDDYSKYFYYGLEKDKTQIFKIEEDTFYNRMYVIDQDNQKSELSEDEMNMIKSKRNQ